MSYQASSWAQRQKAGGAGAKCLLLSLANHADKSGACYPGRATLADECECSPKTITANIAKLEEAGLISRIQRRRANGSRTSDWIVLAPNLADRGEMTDAELDEYPTAVAVVARVGRAKASGNDSSPNDSGPGQVTFSGGPEQSEEKSGSSSEGTRASQLRVGGRAVNAETWRRTTAALDAFNEQAGTSLKLTNGTGAPTEAAKRVYSRLREWPDLTDEQVNGVIARTLASRWWGTDDATIGVVFGPKVFEDNLTREGPRGRQSGGRGASRSGTIGHTRQSKFGHLVKRDEYVEPDPDQDVH